MTQLNIISAGFTGTAGGMTSAQMKTVRNILHQNNVDVLHHGDCVGADAEAHDIAKSLKISIIIHPPKDSKARAFCTGASHSHTPKDYLVRNHDIVNDSDFMIATPRSMKEILRSGTWATIRYARKRNKRLFIVYPNGSVK